MTFYIIGLFQVSLGANFYETQQKNLLKSDIQSNPESKELEQRAESYMIEHSRIGEFSSEFGLDTSSRLTSEDQARLSLSLINSIRPVDLSGLRGLEITYLKQWSDQKPWWFEVRLAQQNARYSYASDQLNFTSSESSSETNISREESTQNLTTASIGLFVRTKMLGPLIESNRFFEYTGFSLGYMQSVDELTSDNFTGPELRMESKLEYRMNTLYFISTRIGLSLAQVTRESKSDQETKKDRTLLYTLPYLGLEIGLYF